MCSRLHGLCSKAFSHYLGPRLGASASFSTNRNEGDTEGHDRGDVDGVAMLTAKKDHEDDVSAILRRLVRDTAREPGAVDYQLHRGEAGAFVVYERYRDQGALEAHLKSDHLSSALKKVESLLVKPPGIPRCSRAAGILPRTLELEGRAIEVHVLPLGPANLVFARTPNGRARLWSHRSRPPPCNGSESRLLALGRLGVHPSAGWTTCWPGCPGARRSGASDGPPAASGGQRI